MNDNIRSMIESNQFAEYKRITQGKLQAHQKGYDKGYRNGVAVGIAVMVGFYLLITLGQKVL